MEEKHDILPTAPESCPSCPAEGQQQPLEKLEAMSAAVLVSVEEAAPQLQSIMFVWPRRPSKVKSPPRHWTRRSRPGDRYP